MTHAPTLDSRRRWLGLLAAGALLAGGCGGDKTYEITEVNERPTPPKIARTGVTAAERLQRIDRVRWTTPPGWIEQDPTSMRIASWRVPGDPAGDVSFGILGGGLKANLNRWRNQMGLAPASDAEFAASPRWPLLGEEATFVDLEGTYSGMGDHAEPGFRLLGLLQGREEGMLFLKFVGPAALVEAQRKAFEALTASLTFEPGPPRRREPPPPPFDVSKLRWTLPEGWTERRPGGMRLATLSPPSAPDVECVIFPMGGDGGGVVSNVNRWRDQMGQEPLSRKEAAELPRLEVLGRSAVFVEITGHLKDEMTQKDIPGAALLGLVCPVEGASLFLKMTGPRDAVLRERDAFLALARSLRLG